MCSVLMKIISEGKLSGIRRESVNYVGYYSQHEETMKTVIQNQAQAGEEKVKDMVDMAMVDCRRDQLWQKLLIDRGSGTVPNLSHLEFLELISLVHHETLDKVHNIMLNVDDREMFQFDPRLAPLVQKSPGWYLGLAKVLQNKYGEFSRQFSSEDGQVGLKQSRLLILSSSSGPPHCRHPPGEPRPLRPPLRGQCRGQPRHRAQGPPA